MTEYGNLIYGRLGLYREDGGNGGGHGKWAWRIRLSSTEKPFRNDANVVSTRSYATETSALIAVHHLATRLGIMLIMSR